MGLAYDPESARVAAGDPDLTEEASDDDVRRRAALFTAAGMALVGLPVFGEVVRLDPPRPPIATPLPAKVDRFHVAALRMMTEQMRALGRAGHGVPGVLSQTIADAERLLTVPAASGDVLNALLAQLAELHTLAGWWHTDGLNPRSAWWHYNKALMLSGDANDALGMIDAVRHAAMLNIDLGYPEDALKLLQLAIGKLSELRDSRVVPALQSGLYVQTARAYALTGYPDHATRDLRIVGLLRKEHDAPGDPFEKADTALVCALTELLLGRVNAAAQYAGSALQTFPDDEARDSAYARITLATTHVIANEPDAVRLTTKAIDTVAGLRSPRGRLLLGPLERTLRARGSSTYTDLAERAARLRGGQLA
jgi:hypothetical protein